MKDDDRTSLYQTFGLFLGLGTQLVILVILGAFGGDFLDRKFGLSPLFLLVGIILGFGVGMYTLYQVLKSRKSREK